MPYPLLRRDERPNPRDSQPSLGIRVTYSSDVAHFFPGDKGQAMALVAAFVPPELLNNPGTTLEFGERLGRLFTLRQHLAGPKLSPDVTESPRVIEPDVANER